MKRIIQCLVFLFVVFLILISCDGRMSHPPGLFTYSDIRVLSFAIERYRMEFGRLPAPDGYWLELERADMLWLPSRSGPPSDRWKRPFVYRVPGEHGDFDLYSCGEDGVDNFGKEDDISNWAGVNEGFYSKSHWAKGRFTVALGLFFGFFWLFFIRIYPCWFVVPLAGLLICMGTLFGGLWVPLGWPTLVSAILLVVLSIYLYVNIRKRGLPKCR